MHRRCGARPSACRDVPPGTDWSTPDAAPGEWAPVEILAAAEALRVPAAVDLAAIVIGALTGGLLAAREGFAVSGVLLLAVSGGLGGGLIRDVLLGDLPPVAHDQPGLPADGGHHRRRSRSSSPAGCPG